jgi:hypothetical protein
VTEVASLEEQRRRIAAQRSLAERALTRRRRRARSVPAVAVGLSVVTAAGALAGWVNGRLPTYRTRPSSVTSSQKLAGTTSSGEAVATARAIRAAAQSLAADNREISALAAALRTLNRRAVGTSGGGGQIGGAGGGGAAGTANIPSMPNLPSITIPQAPPVQAVSGASGAGL